MKKHVKRWLSIVLVIALCIGIGPYIKYDLNAKAEGSLVGDISHSVSDAASDVAAAVKEQTYTYFNFGSYPFWNDNDEYVSTPLTWRVIDEDADCYTLMIDSVLFDSPFGEELTLSWKDSYIREFLNNDFYNQAFDNSMKQDILNTTVTYRGFDKSLNDFLMYYSDDVVKRTSLSKDDYDDYYIEDSTTDKVYILSAEDYMNPNYGFADTRENEVSRIFYYDPVAYAPEDPSDYPTMYQLDWDTDENSEYRFFINDNLDKYYGAVWVWTRDIEDIDLFDPDTTPTSISPHGGLHSNAPLWLDTENQDRNYDRDCLDSAGIQPVIRVKKGSKHLTKTTAPKKPEIPNSFIDIQGNDNPGNNNENTSSRVIRVYPNNKHIYLLQGTSTHLGFELLINGHRQPTNLWKQSYSITDSKTTFITEDNSNDYSFDLKITASHPGTSYLTVSDSKSGVSTTVEITVEELSDTKIYPIRGRFLSKENAINGVVFDNYWYDYDDKAKSYMVHLDAYNYNYYNGAIDIYNKAGQWIESKEIKKFAIPSHLYEVKDEILYLADDHINSKKGSYKSGNETKKTSLEFKVPQGGYFTISNNYSESPGTLVYNTIDLVFDLISHLKKLFKGPTNTSDSKKETLKERYIEKFLHNASKEDRKAMVKLIKTVIKKATKSTLTKQELYDVYTGINSEFVNSCNAIDFDLKKELTKTVFNAAEDVLDFLGGGLLKAGFDVFDFINLGTCVYQIGNSESYPIYTFYSEEYDSKNTGIIITQNNNPIPDTKVQAFRVYDDSALRQYFSNSDLIDNSELYQISLIKDDQVVQPNSKVTVKLPIPSGMNKNKCSVYREESDGQWTKIKINNIENDQYLVFETDHFSLYAIVGESDNLSLKSLPEKQNYSIYEWLDTTGLELICGDKTINKGYYCTPVFFSEPGDYSINVLYGSAQTSFTIHVTKTGFVRDTDEKIKLFDDGRIVTGVTNVKYDPNTDNWYNVVRGVVTPGPTIANNTYGWWYIDKDGKVDFTAQSIYQNQFGWWKTTNGKVTFKEKGVFQNGFGWWRVEDSKVNFKANGIYQNKFGWWKTTNGKVSFKENGVFQNEYGWWKVKDSKVDFGFTGIASNKYGSWYIKNGKVDFNKKGKVKYNNKNYTIKNGKVV